MGLKKNAGGQKVAVKAMDLTGAGVTGDAANITCKVAKDHGAAAGLTDTNPTETEDGVYLFDLAQAETNADHLLFYPESATSGVEVFVLDGANGATDNALDEILGNDSFEALFTDASAAKDASEAVLAKLLAYFRLALRKDAATATDQAAELAEINADAGSGAGGYDNTTDSDEAVRDRGDSAWVTGSSGEFVPVQPRVIHPARVWTYDERSRSRPVDIVKVRAGFAGRLAFAPALNEGEAVRTLDSVTIDGSAVGITDLGPSGDYTQAVFTTAALAAGTYEVVAQVTTTGGDVFTLAATLRVD